MNKILSLLLAVILIFSLTACAQDTFSENGGYYSFTDDTGSTVVLSKKPENTAVLFSSLADVWVTAGGKVSITVGETIERGFADENAVLVDSGAGKTVNTELLISSEPDFVIYSADIEAQRETAALLADTDIPIAQFRIESFDDYLRVLKIFTDITGNENAYKTYGTDIQKKIDSLLSSYSAGEGKTMLFIRAASTAKSTKAKTAEDHFAASMLEELGLYNIADNAPVLLDGLSIEEILTADPDYIFITAMGDEDAAKSYMDSLLNEDTWQSLTAVKNGKVYYLPKDMFQFKPNSGWYNAYEYLKNLLEE